MNFHWSGFQSEREGKKPFTSVHVEIYLCEGPRTVAVERNHILENGDSGWLRYFERQVQTIKKDGDPEAANWYDRCPSWT
jgi:hypothetical protein